RGLVDVVQGNGKLDHAEPSTEVPAGLADRPQQEQAQLVRQVRQLCFVKLAQPVYGVDAVQQRGAGTLAGYVVESARHQTRLWVPQGRGRKQGRSLTDEGR